MIFYIIIILHACTYLLEEIWKIFNIQSNQYYPIFKLWAFSIPIIFIRHPDDIKVTKYLKNLNLFL